MCYYATGRRKESVAKVRLFEGKGGIVVNGMPLDDYFTRETLRMLVMQPLKITNSVDKYNVMATVKGGGMSGQAGALFHGLARALAKADEATRPTLREAGLITRDPRMKERKKYGQKGARKKFQYSKR